MKKCFIYNDEKSNKFWWIDYKEDSLAVNYGKVGSIGKFQTKEFDNEEQCLKAASKLIAAKMKKGYQEDRSCRRCLSNRSTEYQTRN